MLRDEPSASRPNAAWARLGWRRAAMLGRIADAAGAEDRIVGAAGAARPYRDATHGSSPGTRRAGGWRRTHRSALSRYSHRQYQTAAKRQDNKRRLAAHRSPSGTSVTNEPEGSAFPVQNP